jgi:hypothetical protein
MGYLKENGYRVLALKDVERYLPAAPPDDPTLGLRHPVPASGKLALPVEVEATRRNLAYWLENMLLDHRFTLAEAAAVAGMSADEVRAKATELAINAPPEAPRPAVRVLPYPGGRHPRTGFLEGAVDPQRGTKASVFLPWGGYVVLDVPEAVFSNLGLLFLAHTHVPTVWNRHNVVLENVDWTRAPDGSLTGVRTLPNKVAIEAGVAPKADGAALTLSLRNGTDQPLTGLRVQMCAMLKGAHGFEAQTNDNKRFMAPVAAVRSAVADRWILLAWERCGRAWGNPPVPCLHSDPVLPDCAPGQAVRVSGRLRFYEGKDIEREIQRLASELGA